MERLRRLGETIADGTLKFIGGIEVQHPRTREERIEATADFIEKANPQKSIKVVCGSDELPEIIEGIARGLARLQTDEV